MSALEIPGVGERVGREYIRALTFGGSSDADVQITAAQLGTAGGTIPLININEAGVYVKDIDVQIVSKLTTSTGTFTIGDSDDADGYWTDTLLVGTSSGAVYNKSASTVGYAGGKLYTSRHVINVTKGGAAASAVSATSLAKLKVRYIRGCDTNLNANT